MSDLQPVKTDIKTKCEEDEISLAKMHSRII